MSATATTMSAARSPRAASLARRRADHRQPRGLWRSTTPPDGVRQVADPAEAVDGAADRLYRRLGVDGPGRRDRGPAARRFAAYQVDDALMALTDDAWFLHCLPARRGEEVERRGDRRPAQRRLAAGREPHAHRARRAGLDAGRAAMTDARARRLRALADLIRAEPLASQEEVTERLARAGLSRSPRRPCRATSISSARSR